MKFLGNVDVCVCTRVLYFPTPSYYFVTLHSLVLFLLTLQLKGGYGRHAWLLQSGILGEHLIASEPQPLNGCGSTCLKGRIH